MTDSTNAQFDDKLLDVQFDGNTTGYPDELAGHDNSDALAGLGTRDFPDHLWIEQSNWKDKARQNDADETWPDNYRSRWTNQTPTHECTCHSLIQNIEIAYNRQRLGAGLPVYLSPLSVYSEANPRRWGGSYLTKVLGIAMDRGVLPEHHGAAGLEAQTQLFKHTLNCSSGSKSPWAGPWVALRNFPSGWKNTARHFRPLEVVNPRSWEEMVCLLLHGYCVCVGRSGHAIPYTGIVWRGGDLYAKYADSYELHRYDSLRTIKRAVGSSYSVITTVVPDDWTRPAGEDMR